MAMGGGYITMNNGKDVGWRKSCGGIIEVCDERQDGFNVYLVYSFKYFRALYGQRGLNSQKYICNREISRGSERRCERNDDAVVPCGRNADTEKSVGTRKRQVVR
ncbi:hypothetical protein F2P81_003790 [Scophthalmus maximus]|uniref:Uncharacterized protein n=1 Tax=Scophthalmus maximus TaxID=52904 RepID=A0A6A4TRI1_SCOMX|nr:hypothetical protein F2P81_003790 [Scophthalmus maximus]